MVIYSAHKCHKAITKILALLADDIAMLAYKLMSGFRLQSWDRLGWYKFLRQYSIYVDAEGVHPLMTFVDCKQTVATSLNDLYRTTDDVLLDRI